MRRISAIFFLTVGLIAPDVGHCADARDTKTLLVYGYKTIRAKVHKDLTILGFQKVDEAGRINDALSALNGGGYGLIIAGLNIDKTHDGVDFVKKVRANAKLNNAKIVCLANTLGSDSQDDVSRLVPDLKRAGCQALVTYPTDATHLYMKLSSIFGSFPTPSTVERDHHDDPDMSFGGGEGI